MIKSTLCFMFFMEEGCIYTGNDCSGKWKMVIIIKIILVTMITIVM